MPIVQSPAEPTHELGTTRFTSLATPTRGSAETAVWKVEIAPGTPATPHSITREEIFVVLEGVADVAIDGRAGIAAAGDAIIVPADVPFEVANTGAQPLRLLCCMPVGGQAKLADGVVFTPPWSQ
jgi:quercetin dioxygenase-like cupin family protein